MPYNPYDRTASALPLLQFIWELAREYGPLSRNAIVERVEDHFDREMNPLLTLGALEYSVEQQFLEHDTPGTLKYRWKRDSDRGVRKAADMCNADLLGYYQRFMERDLGLASPN